MKIGSSIRLLIMQIGLTAFTLLILIYSQVGSVFATSSTSNVLANVVVSSVCEISLAPNAITFGNVAPGTFHPTNVLVTDSNNGNANANSIDIEGTNWILTSSVGFGVSNTTYNMVSSSSAITGVQLSNTLTPVTGSVVPAGGSNTIYFGVNVPVAQAAGTYTQNIILENSC
jgi:hypothetical protein